MAFNTGSLLAWMRYGDSQRLSQEREERQSTKDALDMFNAYASRNISSAVGLEDLALKETDPGKLALLSDQADTLFTGVDDVDRIINVKKQGIELRQRAVDTRDVIREELDSIVNRMGTTPSEGASTILNSLHNEYISQADNITASAKADLDTRFKAAFKENEFNTWRRQFDVDLTTPEMDYPDRMSEADQASYEDWVAPSVDVALGARTPEAFTEAISRMRTAFPKMREERQSSVTGQRTAINAAVKDAEEQIDIKRETVMNQIKGGISNFKSGLTQYGVHDKDHQGRMLMDSILAAEKYSSSETGDKQQAFDYRGALINIERAIILNSEENIHDLKKDAYELSDKIMTEEHVRKIEDLILKNTTEPDSSGAQSYQATYGSPAMMFELIETWRNLRRAVDSKLTGSSGGLGLEEDFFLDFNLEPKEEEKSPAGIADSIKTEW